MRPDARFANAHAEVIKPTTASSADNVRSIIARYGNTSSATVSILVDELRERWLSVRDCIRARR